MLAVAWLEQRAAPRPRHVDRADDFLSGAGEIVGVRLRVGQDLLGDPLPRDSGARQSVHRRGCGGPQAGRRPGRRRSGRLRARAAPGLLVIGYRSNPSAVELTAEKFNQYLKEEGLDAVAALRARRNETGAAAHEIFSRCAKSLVLSGAPSEAQGDRRARVSRSNSWPSEIPTRSAPVRIFRFA